MILNTLVVLGVPGSSRAIEGGGLRHRLICAAIGQQHMQGLCAVGQTLGVARPWPVVRHLRLKLSCSLFVDGQGLAPTGDLWANVESMIGGYQTHVWYVKGKVLYLAPMQKKN